MEEMVEHCVPLMPLGQTEPEACRSYMRGLLLSLERWQQESEEARSQFLQKLLDSSCSFLLFVG